MSDDVPKMYIGRHVKCSLLLSDFNETLILWTGLGKCLDQSS